jgi:CheY-like chemotaxis protein
VSFALAPDLRTVRVDPSSIEQVLLNLAINARDAMPRGGRLSIETANVDVGSLEVDTHAAMPPGQYVVLSVGDTGAGMDEETRVRIFEPFFTTKEQGKGIGLGLATVYGIVKQSGGYIWVFSQPDHGTVFKLYLPPVVVPALTRTREEETEGTGRGWETVLLVEDQDAVRALAREVLRRRGYVVLEARHGLDALRVAERHPDPIHLLVTDIAMPHMDGRELVERLADSRSDMKVLFISTFADQEVTEGRANVEFLQKPFTPDSLIRKVRQMLGAKERAMS